jgi:hypothetical protein
MVDIDTKLREKLDKLYDHIDSQEMSASLRSFSPTDVTPRRKFLQPLLATTAGLVAAAAVVIVGLTTHTGSKQGPSATGGVATAVPSPISTATPMVTPPPATPNPAFPGTTVVLTGANTGNVSVTALRCANKNQSGDTVIEGTVGGSHLIIQFLNPAIFGKPPFQTPSPGQAGQPYVSLWVWTTDESTAPNWGTHTGEGVTYGRTSISVNVDLPALARATGTTHVSGTIACAA